MDWATPDQGGITMYDFTFRGVHVRTRKREAEPHQGSYSGGETGAFHVLSALLHSSDSPP